MNVSTDFSKSYSTYNSPKIRSVRVSVFHTHMTNLIFAVWTDLKFLKLLQLRKVKCG